MAHTTAVSKRKLAADESGKDGKPTPQPAKPAQTKRAKRESGSIADVGNGHANGHGDDSTALTDAANDADMKMTSGRRQV